MCPGISCFLSPASKYSYMNVQWLYMNPSCILIEWKSYMIFLFFFIKYFWQLQLFLFRVQEENLCRHSINFSQMQWTTLHRLWSCLLNPFSLA